MKRNIINIMLLTATIFLLSCATSSQVYTPSGKKAHKINCSGTVMTKSDCMKKAGNICKTRGYTEIDYREEAGPGLILADITIPGTITRFMTIQCN
jgi:hypothetical protein